MKNVTKSLKSISNVRNLSIRSQLMISLMAIIIPFILLSVLAYNYYLGFMTHKLIESRILVLSEMSRNVGQLLRNMESITQQVKLDKDVQGVLSDKTDNEDEVFYTCSRAIRVMAKLVITSDNIASIFAGITSHNMKYYSNAVGFLSENEVLIYPWYNDIKDTNSSVWVSTRVNENSTEKENIFTYVTPVVQLSNFKILGNVFVSFKEASFYKILNRSAMEKDEKIILLDNKNRIFYSSDRNYKPDSELENMLSMQNFNSVNGYFYTGMGSKEALVTYTTIPGYGWRLVSVIRIGEFSRELAQINRIMYIIMFFCISISIMMGILLYRSITKPLGALAVSMGHFGQGDFSNQEYDKATKNEISKIYYNFNRMTTRVANLMEKNYQITQQKKDAEFKALHAQINPHFLYNTLDAINWLAMLNNQDEISDMVKNLSMFFRNTISDGKQMVTIEEELKQIEVYIKIERFRYKNRFDVEYNLDKRLFKCFTFKFILQPFVENCLIHGFRERSGQGRIYIQLYSKEDKVFFEIIDDGTGMTEKQIEEVLKERTDGYGIMNVDERIRLKYGDDYGVRISSELGKGTTVSISIPRMEHEPELEN